MIVSKEVEEMSAIESFDMFLRDIKPVKEKDKKFKSLEKYKIFREKLLEKENIYIRNLQPIIENKTLYILKWYQW